MTLEETDVAPAFDTFKALQMWAEDARLRIGQRLMDDTLDAKAVPIAYRELYDLQLQTLEQPPMLWRRWMGEVLFALAALNRVNQEPMFGSMVINAASREVTPDGYRRGVQERYGMVRLIDPVGHAKLERAKLIAVYRPVIVHRP